ncbi:MAG TPA: hypothetical protein VFS21_21180 [Roseiflexaceae bacterium]|nr:hypothetical protein [Roseiflexaceae bacterium]
MQTVTLLRARLAEGYLRALAWLHAALLVRRPAQGLVEYGLILVLIMVVCVAILSLVGKNVSEVWYEKILGAFD